MELVKSLEEHRKLGNLTVTVKKTVPSPEAIQILYQRMRYEYEFYYYVKEQFHLLKRKFGLKSHIRKPRPRPEFFIPSPLETEEPIDDEEEDDEKWLEDIYKREEHHGSQLQQARRDPAHFYILTTGKRTEKCSMQQTGQNNFMRQEVIANEKDRHGAKAPKAAFPTLYKHTPESLNARQRIGPEGATMPIASYKEMFPVLLEDVSKGAVWKQHDMPEVETGEHKKERGKQDCLDFEDEVEKQLLLYISTPRGMKLSFMSPMSCRKLPTEPTLEKLAWFP
ncbi:hypothetical protein BTVI_151993 [Pitangus sulphuratus]|nr:hypothetical protein BTVI_151993 [Pitangus sulphuratus]